MTFFTLGKRKHIWRGPPKTKTNVRDEPASVMYKPTRERECKREFCLMMYDTAPGNQGERDVAMATYHVIDGRWPTS